jgi:hypothetical protein
VLNTMPADLALEDGRFTQYMAEFEATVLATAVARGQLGKRENLPVRPGKLAKTGFGALMGQSFGSPVPFAVDYYGHLKRSHALLQEIDCVREQLCGKQVKTITCLVVHFASIRIEHIARLNPKLVGEFPQFKHEVLKSRGFKNNF